MSKSPGINHPYLYFFYVWQFYWKHITNTILKTQHNFTEIQYFSVLNIELWDNLIITTTKHLLGCIWKSTVSKYHCSCFLVINFAVLFIFLPLYYLTSDSHPPDKYTCLKSRTVSWHCQLGQLWATLKGMPITCITEVNSKMKKSMQYMPGLSIFFRFISIQMKHTFLISFLPPLAEFEYFKPLLHREVVCSHSSSGLKFLV